MLCRAHITIHSLGEYYTILDQYTYIIKISSLNSDDFRLHCGFQGCVCQVTKRSIDFSQTYSMLCSGTLIRINDFLIKKNVFISYLKLSYLCGIVLLRVSSTKRILRSNL